MNYHIKTTTEFGRGLYAGLDIKKNKVITSCELLVLNAIDTTLVNSTDLQFYTFKYEGAKDCLCLGDGEIFNHSTKANVGYVLEFHPDQDRKIMTFYALRDIKADEQLFIDYTADVKVDTTAYVNKNLTGVIK
jgi:uncharacterized protein